MRRRVKVPGRVKEVLSFFVRHPRCADSVEGVTRWRVRQEALRFTIEEVREALAWLAGRGVLLHEDVPGVPTLFRLNQAKTREAKQLLMVSAPPPARSRRRPPARATRRT